MKKQFLVSLFFMVSSLCIMTASDAQQAKDPKDNTVILRGDLEIRNTRSADEPITAIIFADALNIHFYRNLGTVTVHITDSTGSETYTADVNTGVESSLCIPLHSFATGSYTITFTCAAGSLYGDFEL